MSLPSHFLLGLFAWFCSEVGVFILVAQNVGLGGALLLGIATSLAGFVLLKHTGNAALKLLRSMVSGAPPPKRNMLDGLIRALAAVLLILPGFISDLAGLALAAPSVRQFLARRLADGSGGFPTRRGGSAAIVDLSPEDWVSLDQDTEPSRR